MLILRITIIPKIPQNPLYGMNRSGESSSDSLEEEKEDVVTTTVDVGILLISEVELVDLSKENSVDHATDWVRTNPSSRDQSPISTNPSPL